MTANRDQDSSGADRLDATLRAALEPDPATVDRLVRGALAEPEPRPAAHRWRWAAVAATLLAAVALLIPRLEPSNRAPVTPSQAATSPPATTTERIAEAPATPATLRISNEHGPVTVTTPAGSKLVFLTRAGEPGDAPIARGDAS